MVQRDADGGADALVQQLAVQRKGRRLQVAADPGAVVPHDPPGARSFDRRLDAFFHRRPHLGVQREDEQAVLRFVVEEQACPVVGDEPPQLRDDHPEDRADAEAGIDDAGKLADELDLLYLLGGNADGRVAGGHVADDDHLQVRLPFSGRQHGNAGEERGTMGAVTAQRQGRLGERASQGEEPVDAAPGGFLLPAPEDPAGALVAQHDRAVAGDREAGQVQQVERFQERELAAAWCGPRQHAAY